MEKIDEIRSKLDSLPKGYISIKTISGKKYYYLKYYENNKQISKYVKKSEIDNLKNQLKKRKELENILKEYEKSTKNIHNLSNNAKNYTGSIMSGDIKVATYKNGELIYKNEKLCPLLIKRTSNISAFLKGRVIDSSRTNSRLLKKVMNITTKNDEHISLYVYGAVVTDNYWFKPSGSHLKYKDISFENDYYSDLALKGELVIYPKSSKHTPQITAIGSFEKCWKKINGKWWLYKKGSIEQIFSELFCSMLAIKLNIPTAIYEYDDGYIRTLNFADKYNFDPMIGLMGDEESYEEIFNTLLTIDLKLADQYLLLSFFDCLINNVDRHNENLGFLRDKKTGRIISLAPNFDNNLALLGFDKKLKMNPQTDGFIKMFIKFLKTNDVAFKRYKTLNIPKLDIKIIKKCLLEMPIKLDGYDISKYIIDRYNYLISFIKK